MTRWWHALASKLSLKNETFHIPCMQTHNYSVNHKCGQWWIDWKLMDRGREERIGLDWIGWALCMCPNWANHFIITTIIRWFNVAIEGVQWFIHQRLIVRVSECYHHHTYGMQTVHIHSTKKRKSRSHNSVIYGKNHFFLNKCSFIHSARLLIEMQFYHFFSCVRKKKCRKCEKKRRT